MTMLFFSLAVAPISEGDFFTPGSERGFFRSHEGVSFPGFVLGIVSHAREWFMLRQRRAVRDSAAATQERRLAAEIPDIFIPLRRE